MIVVTWGVSLAEMSNRIVMPNMKVFYIKIIIIIIVIIISFYILSQHNRIINKRHNHIIINKRNK